MPIVTFLLSIMTNNNFKEKSFDFAAGVAKQLITLSTAFITITITFSKDITKDHSGIICLYLSWIAFGLTIVFGIWTLMALTGTLKFTIKDDNKSIYDKNIKNPALAQVILFILALLFTIIYGFNCL